MTRYLTAGILALGTGLATYMWKKRRETNITINDFHRMDNHCEASVTDADGNTFRVYGENATWWYKSNGEKVPDHIAKVITDYRTEYMGKLIKSSLSPIDDKVIIRDGKKLLPIK